MTKISFSSDWHGDAVTAGADRFEDVFDRVTEVVRDAINFKADFHFMLGDLTDPDHARSHRVIAKAIEMSFLLHDNGVEPIWITGNHDVIDDGFGSHTMMAIGAAGFSVIDHPSLAQCFNRKTGKKLKVLAMPYTSPSHRYNPAKFVEHAVKQKWNPDLVVGHLNLEGIEAGSETSEMPRGRDVFWPIEALDTHYPDVPRVGGHYHKPQTFKKVTIVGSLERLRFSEEDFDPKILKMIWRDK